MRLIDRASAAGWAAKLSPACLDRLLHTANAEHFSKFEDRVLAGRARHEDAVVVSVPSGKALVQTVDLLSPVVNDPFYFGRIAAVNALSDVYALGGEPWSAMNIACFPQSLADDPSSSVLSDILRGGLNALDEAGAVLCGGHTVSDNELKYGLSVTGIIDPECVATNDGLRPGDILILTKPLGSGILSTALKARWDGTDAVEETLIRFCSRLNVAGSAVIQSLHLSAATDITGFGLAGHALEMALASGVTVILHVENLPLMDRTLELASNGLIPAGTHLNRQYASCQTLVMPDVDDDLEIVAFDAQTSGGLLLAVPPEKVAQAQQMLVEAGDIACPVGEVLPPRGDGKSLILHR